MAENLSLRARIREMAIGDIIVVAKGDFSPSVIHTTVNSVKRDLDDGRNYKVKSIDNGVEVRRIV